MKRSSSSIEKLEQHYEKRNGPLELHYMVSFLIPVDSPKLQEYLEKNQGRNATFTVTVLDEQCVNQPETIITDKYLQTAAKIDRLFYLVGWVSGRRCSRCVSKVLPDDKTTCYRV